jgi:putative FmdB family regulatory protein
MPSYDYDCMSCAKRYTKVRPMSEDDPGYTCETCNKPLVRVYLNAGFILNGSGFYSTDNRKK